MSELAEIVGRASSTHCEAGHAPQGAAVVDREVVAVFLPDAKRVVPLGKVEGDQVIALAGQVAEVFKCLACHHELGTIAVELAEVDDEAPLFVAGFGH
jgi:hypothetical protein